MPTYQYVCTECGGELEVVQRFADTPLTECPSCQGRLRKRFSAVGVVFKGSGFYRTDSRAGSNGSSREKSTSSNGEKPATSSEKSGGKTETSTASTSSSPAASSNSANGSSTGSGSTSKTGSAA